MRSRHLLICLGLSVLTLACFAQVCWFDFVELDDPIYVIDNANVAGGLSLASCRWAWTTFYAGFWQPLCWLSLQLDASLYGYSGPQPGEDALAVGAWGFHTTNLALHLANVLLLYRLLWLMTGAIWRSAMVAALFSVHPMRVESVAWITERKDVLSAFFFLLALLSYVRWVRRPGLGAYLLLVLFTFLGLASKPMLVTLPAVLLLLDYWPLGRWQRGSGVSRMRLIVEKIPLFALSLLFSLLTLHGHDATRRPVSLEQRLAGTVMNYGWYLKKTFWPSDLGILQEYESQTFSPAIILALVLLVSATIMAVQQARTRPEGIVGWLWFLGMLFPVSGMLPSGAEGHASRFSYLPHVGLFIWIVWGADHVLRRLRLPARGCLATVVILALGLATWHQAGYWKDTRTLFELAPDLDKNGRACIILATFYADRKEFAEAIEWCEKALDVEPRNGHYHFIMAQIQARAGNRDLARRHIELSLIVQPERPGAHFEAAKVYGLLGEEELRAYHEQRHAEREKR